MASLPNSDARIRVLVADPVAMSCRLLADALQRNKRYQSDAAITQQEVLEALSSNAFEVVVMSSNFSGEHGEGGFELVREIRNRHPDTGVVVLLDVLEREAVLHAFRAGARGVFCRSDSFQTLCKCIVCVHEGQVWASSMELQFVLEALVTPNAIVTHGLNGSRSLSKREEEIAGLVAEGLSNRQISQRLDLSEHTIKNYLFRVFEKLRVNTRVELALYALNQGRMPPQSIDSSLKRVRPVLTPNKPPS